MPLRNDATSQINNVKHNMIRGKKMVEHTPAATCPEHPYDAGIIHFLLFLRLRGERGLSGRWTSSLQLKHVNRFLPQARQL